MRPTPAELLQGVRDGLETVVAPAVTDPAVQAQISLMVMVLGNVVEQWDVELERSHAAIARCESVLERAAPVAERYAPDLGVRLARVASDRTDNLATGELVRRRAELAGAIAELVALCEGPAASDDEDVVRLRTEAYAAVTGSP